MSAGLSEPAIRELMRRNIEQLWGASDPSLIPELYTEDIVDHNPAPGQEPGHAGLRSVLAEFSSAFPDLEMELHGTLADRDFGVDFWTFRATHTGPLFGRAPTGRRVEFTGIDVVRVRDGRISEIWHVEDVARMLAQLDAPAPRSGTAVSRRYVDVDGGQLHLATAGPSDGDAVLLLHQTPRSWDEYRDVLPLLADAGLHAIALDTPGQGASSPTADTIEGFAAAAGAVLDALDVRTAAVVGHHTGGVIAVELAAAAPERVDALVLSCTPYVDEGFRTRPGPGVDEVTPSPDGDHLTALWRGRQGFYPTDRPELLGRFVRDALAAADPAAGHSAVRAYRMEDRLPRVRARTLLVEAPADPFSSPQLPALRAALPGADVVSLPGGMVPLPDQLPAEFAAAVVGFLR